MFQLFRKKERPAITLNGILVENPSGRYTAFFEEFPDIVAEGDCEEDAKRNLVEAFLAVVEFKLKQRHGSKSVSDIPDTGKHTVKHFHQNFGQLQTT